MSIWHRTFSMAIILLIQSEPVPRRMAYKTDRQILEAPVWSVLNVNRPDLDRSLRSIAIGDHCNVISKRLLPTKKCCPAHVLIIFFSWFATFRQFSFFSILEFNFRLQEVKRFRCGDQKNYLLRCRMTLRGIKWILSISVRYRMRNTSRFSRSFLASKSSKSLNRRKALFMFDTHVYFSLFPNTSKPPPRLFHDDTSSLTRSFYLSRCLKKAALQLTNAPYQNTQT